MRVLESVGLVDGQPAPDSLLRQCPLCALGVPGTWRHYVYVCPHESVCLARRALRVAVEEGMQAACPGRRPPAAKGMLILKPTSLCWPLLSLSVTRGPITSPLTTAPSRSRWSAFHTEYTCGTRQARYARQARQAGKARQAKQARGWLGGLCTVGVGERMAAGGVPSRAERPSRG